MKTSSNIRETTQADTLSQEIIKTLLYFQVFSYPLTSEEIIDFTKHPGTSPTLIKKELDRLLQIGWIHKIKHYYLTKAEEGWINRREEGNKRAEKHLPLAYKFSKWIARFPYVRAVFISGSLSKNWMPEDGDIDYFIVTKPGRLWVARTFLVLFKKVFLLNSHKYFCVNYFVDTEHLEIEEKNQFTATEVATLIPTCGSQLYQDFFLANRWIKEYYPQFPKRSTEDTIPAQNPMPKKLLEFCLNTPFGEWLDSYFMKITMKYWNKKFKKLNKNAFSIALKSRKYTSKHHPSNFQEKVLQKYSRNLRAFEATHNMAFHAPEIFIRE